MLPAQAETGDPPAAPTGLSASGVSSDSVTLTWDDPGDSSITGHQVLRRSRDGSEYGDGEGAAEFAVIADDTSSAATTYIDASVTPRTRYVYLVKAINPAGTSGQSGYLNVDAPEAPPDRPLSPARGSRPNVVLILADDLGWGDVETNNPDSAMTTPRIDGIAAAGVNFTDAHSPSSNCTGTRYGLLTGRYAWRTWLTSGVLNGYDRPLIGPDRPTLGTLLQGHGYRTAAVGKWHLGMDFARLPDAHEVTEINRGIDFDAEILDSPVDHGFDEFFGTSANLTWHVPTYIRNNRFTANPDRGNQPESGLIRAKEVLDRLTEEGVGFIERAAPEDDPFFLYLPLNAPHVPMAPNDHFRDSTDLGRYGDFVAQIDWTVGQVLDALERTGASENTLVIFTSDNGSYMGGLPNHLSNDHTEDPRAFYYRYDTHQSNGGWFGLKGTINEGGHRVPLLLQWPRKIEAGSTVNATVSLTDLYATLADIMEEEPESGVATDSLSLLPLLLGESETRGTPVVHHSGAGMFALRDGRWKLVFGNGRGSLSGRANGEPFGTPWRLYDLEQDPREVRNAARSNPAVMARMEAALDRIRSTENGTLPANAALSKLSLAGIDIGAFNPDEPSYSATVDRGIETVEVTALPTETDAGVSISTPEGRLLYGKPRRGRVEVGLAESSTTITITVEAPDKSATATYTVTVTRAGEAAIAGIPLVGETLTADTSGIAGENGLSDASFSHQWVSNDGIGDTDIEGATNASYVLTAEDLGKTIRVRVSFTDDVGNEETLTSPATAPVRHPVDAVAWEGELTAGQEAGIIPVMSGYSSFGDLGGILSPDTFVLDETTYRVQFLVHVSGGLWLGMTGELPVDFTLQVGDSAHRGSESKVPRAISLGAYWWASAPPGWSADGPVQVSLTVHPDVPLGDRQKAPVAGYFRDAPAEHGGDEDFSFRIYFTELVSTTAGALRDHVLAVTGGAVSGVEAVGDDGRIWAVSVTPESADAVTIEIEAGLDCELSGAVCTADGRRLFNRMELDVAGPPPAADGPEPDGQNNPATGPPAIRGQARVGATLRVSLSALDDADGLSGAVFAYQWLADDAEIQGATASTHAVDAGQEGKAIRVRVSFTDDAGNEEILTSAATDTVAVRANSPATGLPTIRGTAQVGETLLADTSSIADSDGLTNVAFSYQWIRNDSSTDTDIQNATGSTYTLVSDDAGKFIKVEVSFTDDEGNKETLTSSATTAVEAQANAEPPSYITVAVTKRTSDPNNIVTNFTISWFDSDDCTTDYNAYLNIAAGNRPGQETPGSQHHLGSVASDGAQIANGLSGIQGPMEGFNVELYCGSTESGRLVSRVRIPRGPGARPFTGTYSSEPPLSALSVSHGTLTPTFNSHTFDYTVSDIANADTRITITATPKEGYAVDFFEWSGGPVIHGVAYSPGPGRIITGLSDDCFYGVGDHFGQLPELADADPDTPGFQVDVYDGENYIHIRVYPTAFCAGGEGYGLEMTRAEGSVSLIRPNRPATGRVSIDPDLGRLAEPTSPWPGLDLRTDTDHSNFRDRDGLTNPTYSYQWLADDAEMAGETSTGYRVKLADLGKTLKVRVSFTDDRGTEETLTSTSTKVVKLRNYRPTGEPIIRGTLEVGQTLTADISGISDPNGMTNATFSYRWKYTTYYGSASTDSEYTLVSRDEGTSLTWLEVTYTDDDGHEERLYTERQGLVAPSPTKATGAPVITGVAQVGETLTVDTSGIADSDGLVNVSYSYQWFSNDGTMIRSHWRNTASTYTLVDADKGRTIQVHVYFTDDAGFEEKLTSAATVTVTATTPEAPRSVDVEPAGTGRLSLSWQEPASNGGSEISGYTVEWKKAADSWDTDEDVSKATATGTTHTITGLTLDVEYAVRVIAINDAGDGPASDEVKATPVAQASQQQSGTQNTPATGQPTISGTAQVGETLTVDTSGIADADGVTNASYGGSWYANDTEGRSATGQGGYVLGGKAPGYDLSYTVSRGAVGKTVKIEVYFTDDAGNREWLASAKTGVVTATTPAAPENVTASLTASGDLVLSWEVPTWDPMSEFFGEQTWGDGGSAITGYIVQWKEASSSWDTEADGSEATVTETTHTIRDLTSGTEYTARVIAVNSVGRGSPSDEASVTTNTPATGTPTISGTAQVGQTLTASTSGISDTDGLTNVTYSYQWLTSRDTEIEGATSSTYSLQTADEGKTIRVRVSFTDDAGNAETLTSAATAEVEVPLTAELQNVPESHNGEDAFTFRILFSEPVTVGYQALKEDSFEISDGTITRARRVNGRDDLRQFTVRPSSNLDVAIVLPADRPCDDDGAICTSDGKRLSNRLALTVPGPAPANALATGAPTINGTSQVGQTLTATTSNIADSDGLVNAAYGYQWVRNDGRTDAEIQEATGSTYTLDAADEGKTVKVRVSFTDDAGNDESLTSAATDTVAVRANSPATGLPTISGEAQVGETLTAHTSDISDEDGLDSATFTYQWMTDAADIGGATGSAYTLVDADVGRAIRVRVSFTDDAGSEETLTSAATAEVAARPNSPPTGAPTISGTSRVDEALTADTSDIADADGLDNASFSYQWLADDSDISGATGSTYRLADADEGKTIKVRVSFTDGRGHDETLTSAATAAVAARPPLTASFEGTPSGHDEENAFTFELRFSEEFSLSYETLRDHAFTVTGGTVKKAQRLDKPSNIQWRITVEPDSGTTVTVVLPITENCDDQGAICTEDGRMLSNRLELSVGGPGQ